MICLDAVGADFGATLSGTSSPASAIISVPRPGGDRHEFSLELIASGNVVTVREAPPNLLPVFCPDRHINPGGSFCLGWGSTALADVIDENSARAWWTAVVRFLQLQLSANETRMWLNGANDWAHGEAATHQARAEAAAGQLGPNFRNDLRAGKFSVSHEEHKRGGRIELRRRGLHVARVFVGPPVRLKEDNVRCPCDDPAGPTVGDCGDHADHLAVFATELWHWQQAETRFGRDLALRGQACCGTLDDCKLRDAIERVKTSSDKKRRHALRHRPRRRPRL